MLLWFVHYIACYSGIRLFNMQSVLAGYLFNGTRFYRVSIMHNPLIIRDKKEFLHSGNRTLYTVLATLVNRIEPIIQNQFNENKWFSFNLITRGGAGGVEINIKIMLLSEIRVIGIICITCFQWYNELNRVIIVEKLIIVIL